MHAVNYAIEGNWPERSVHDNLFFNHDRVFVEGNMCQISDAIVINDQANRDPFNGEIKLHLLYYVALHVMLDRRSHHIV